MLRRRSLILSALAAPFVSRAPGLLMPVKPPPVLFGTRWRFYDGDDAVRAVADSPDLHLCFTAVRTMFMDRVTVELDPRAFRGPLPLPAGVDMTGHELLLYRARPQALNGGDTVRATLELPFRIGD